MENYLHKEETANQYYGNYLELFMTLVNHITSKYKESNFNKLQLYLSINDRVYSFYETIKQDKEDFPLMVLGFIKTIVSDISGEDLDMLSDKRKSDLYSEENVAVVHLLFITEPKSYN